LLTPIGQIENDVLIGQHGHLFLAGGRHRVLEFSSGRVVVPEGCYAIFEANLTQRAAWTASRGAEYSHLIFPEKQSVLLDSYPLPEPICLGEAYLKRCPAIADKVVYPRDLLRLHQRECFLHTDTHLSNRGTILALRDLVEKLTGSDASAFAANLLEQVCSEEDYCGDLGSKLSPPRSHPELYFSGKTTPYFFSNRLRQNHGIVDIWISFDSVSDKRLLIFGDSFGRDAARFGSFFFREIMFLRTPFYHIDIVDQFRPDFVVTENVERYLDFVQHDSERPSFHMFPFLSNSATFVPSREFAEAFSALLNFPRRPYKNFIDKLRRVAETAT